MAALDKTNGEILWTRVLGDGKSGHGGVRSCIMDDGDIVCAGYVSNSQPGLFMDKLPQIVYGSLLQVLFLWLMRPLQQFGGWTLMAIC